MGSLSAAARQVREYLRYGLTIPLPRAQERVLRAVLFIAPTLERVEDGRDLCPQDRQPFQRGAGLGLWERHDVRSEHRARIIARRVLFSVSATILSVLLLASPASAAIAFDAATNGGNSTTGTLSWTHTTTGSNRLLVVGFKGDSTLSLDDISGVTYNGVAMTAIYTGQTAGSDRFYYLYYLLNPASGANTVQITAFNAHYLFGASASYTGVQQSGQPDAMNSNSGTATGSLTTSVTTVADNSWVVMFGVVSNDDGTLAAGTGATERVATDFNAGALFDSNASKTPAGSYSMTWTTPGSSYNKGSLLVSFSPAGGGGATAPPTLSLLGVGK
jgi:hypothetical protein